MTDLSNNLQNLVIANHILAHEGVVDAFGHVSFRHPDNPDHYWLSCSRAPELVVAEEGVSPGQACVFYDPDSSRIFGGGWIWRGY